jgi:hypothetical protein
MKLKAGYGLCRPIVWAAALAVLNSVAAAASEFVDSVSVPFRMVNNHILVTARVDGSIDATFVVDTGCALTSIEQSLYDRLRESGIEELPNSSLRLRTFGFGPISLQDVKVKVVQLPYAGGTSRPQGILGESILRNYRVTIDYIRNRLVFEDPNSPPRYSADHMVRARPALNGTGMIFNALLDNRAPLPCLFDTGAQRNIAPIGLVSVALTRRPRLTRELTCLKGETVKAATAKFKSLHTAGLTFKNPVFSVVYPDPRHHHGRGCVLNAKDFATVGNSLWKGCVVTLDYARKRIAIERPE